MDQHDIEIALMREPFIAGSGALPFLVKRLWKMAGGLVCLCRRGTAKVNIGIKEYTIGEDEHGCQVRLEGFQKIGRAERCRH